MTSTRRPEWGDKYAEACERFGREYDTLRSYKAVAQDMQFGVRNPNLTWNHHRAVAPLPPAAQKKWLKKAEKEGLSVSELRKAIRDDQPDKELQRPMLGAQRRIEARIGQLLGKPEKGGRGHKGSAMPEGFDAQHLAVDFLICPPKWGSLMRYRIMPRTRDKLGNRGLVRLAFFRDLLLFPAAFSQFGEGYGIAQRVAKAFKPVAEEAKAKGKKKGGKTAGKGRPKNSSGKSLPKAIPPTRAWRNPRRNLPSRRKFQSRPRARGGTSCHRLRKCSCFIPPTRAWRNL